MIDHFEFGRVEMFQDISPHETAHSVLEYRDIIGVTLYKAYALEIKHFCPPPYLLVYQNTKHHECQAGVGKC